MGFCFALNALRADVSGSHISVSKCSYPDWISTITPSINGMRNDGGWVLVVSCTEIPHWYLLEVSSSRIERLIIQSKSVNELFGMRNPLQIDKLSIMLSSTL